MKKVPLWCSECEKWTTKYEHLKLIHYECGHKVSLYQLKGDQKNG